MIEPTAAPTAGWMGEDDTHVFPLRVYYEDTDAGGIVYHAAYLRFMERARTEMLRLLGTTHWNLDKAVGDQSLNASDRGRPALGFAVRRCTLHFLRPARLDDALEVRTRLAAVRGASLDAAQVVCRSGQELARGLINLACLDEAGRPQRLPARLRAALQLLGSGRLEGRQA